MNVLVVATTGTDHLRVCLFPSEVVSLQVRQNDAYQRCIRHEIMRDTDFLPESTYVQYSALALEVLAQGCVLTLSQ